MLRYTGELENLSKYGFKPVGAKNAAGREIWEKPLFAYHDDFASGTLQQEIYLLVNPLMANAADGQMVLVSDVCLTNQTTAVSTESIFMLDVLFDMIRDGVVVWEADK
jgi:hypothetical protein